MTKVVLITGWDRSGSTIIAGALGSTPGVATIGEVTNLWERGFGQDRECSCGERFGRCAFWQAVAQSAFGEDLASIAHRAEVAMRHLGNAPLALRQLAGMKGTLRNSEAYGDLLAPVYRAAADVTGAAVVVDSSKKPWHSAVAAQLEEFESYVLHVIRDPRGVAFSFRKRVKYDGSDAMARHSPTFSSLAWLYRNRITEAEWSASPRYFRLRYEDFVAEPKAALEAVLRWLGHEAQPPLTEDGKLRLIPMHNIAGNPARFQSGPVALRIDDAWRSGLTPATRRYVGALTSLQRRRYGYS